MAKKRSYPANILILLHVNEVAQSSIDYDDLTEDQMQGLEYVIQNNLTEREAILWQHFFQEDMSMEAIAEKYDLPVKRIGQIINQSLAKIERNPEWIFYIANGYEAQTEYLQEQLEIEEQKYCEIRGITSEDHLFYQDIAALNFPMRVYNPLTKAGIKTVRDLVIYIGSSNKIRKLGELSSKLVRDKLAAINLIPAELKCDRRYARYYNVSKLDEEVQVFQKINSY